MEPKTTMIRAAIAALMLATCADSYGADRRVPADFPTIQAAVDAATTGDRVLIAAGKYVTQSVIVTGKALRFEAEVPGSVTLRTTAGAILAVSGTSLTSTIAGIRFVDGSPAINAGASMDVFGCEFTGGTSGIQHSSGVLFVDGCSFADATGAANGGGIFIDGERATVRRSSFSNLSTSHYGGGIRVSAPSLIEYCAFRSCTSTYGGAIGHHQRDLVVRGCVFDGNPSRAIYLQGSPAQIRDCHFQNSNIETGGAGPQTVSASMFCGSTTINGTWVDGGGNAFGLACDEDCNGNGTPDIAEWAADATANCDASAGLDSCQLAADPGADCTGNGRPDACDIADAIVGDCDGDGRPDPCQIADGQSDKDGNGVPDGCDPDCDGDGVIDAIEISGGAGDCNGDLVPDDCAEPVLTLFDTGPQRVYVVGNGNAYGTFACGRTSSSSPQRWTAQAFTLADGCGGYAISRIAVNGTPSTVNPAPQLGWKIWFRRPGNPAPGPSDLLAEGVVPTPAAEDDPRSSPTNERYRLQIDVRLLPGDYWLTVYGSNGSSLSNFNWYGNPAGGIHVAQSQMLRSDRYPVPGFLPWAALAWGQVPGLDPADRFNTVFAVEGRVGIVDCDANGISDAIQLAADPGLDCDANLRLDACQDDCDKDGVPNSCEIAAGEPDVDVNGIPDRCECIGDLYVNGRVDGADLGIMLSEWGPVTPTTVADLDRNGVVSGADLGILLGRWGPCPN
jgi:hypothetical protein